MIITEEIMLIGYIFVSQINPTIIEIEIERIVPTCERWGYCELKAKKYNGLLLFGCFKDGFAKITRNGNVSRILKRYFVCECLKPNSRNSYWCCLLVECQNMLNFGRIEQLPFLAAKRKKVGERQF